MAREYKDSGIEWIGLIPKEWTIAKLKQIGSYINGYAFKPEDWSDLGKPIIRIQDLTGSISNPNYFSGTIDYRYLITRGDILVSWAATLDAFIWEKEEGWLNQHIFKAVPISSVNPRFFYWLIKVAMDYMNNDNKHGIVMQHVTVGLFGNFIVGIPPLSEQQKIADYLDKVCGEVDEMIALQEKMIEELKAYKQSIITEAVTKGLNPNVPMKNSSIDWIGEIPEHWKIVKAKYYVIITNGSAPQTEGDIPVYGSGSTSFKTCGEYKDGPTVLIGRKGATLHIPHYIEGRYWNVDTAFDVKCKENMLLKYYYYLAVSFDYKYYISQTTLPGMAQSSYNNMIIPMPPLPEQQSIASYLDTKCSEIDSLIAIKQQKITELKEYKKSVIYEYVTGKKEVV
jgi:type I restriction enzyme S subunit